MTPALIQAGGDQGLGYKGQRNINKYVVKAKPLG